MLSRAVPCPPAIVDLISITVGSTLAAMGFFSRLLIPRGARRAVHPVRAVTRAVTPRPIKKARRAMHPLRNLIYSFERSLTTTPRGNPGRSRSSPTPRAQVFNHGTCPVNHRSAAAAAKCRNH